MAEYIEREALFRAIENADLDVIADYGEYGSEWGFSREAIRKVIGSIPTEDVAPVVHGRWIDQEGPDEDGNVDEWCSMCMHSDTHSPNVKVPYCWFCGAKMEGTH